MGLKEVTSPYPHEYGQRRGTEVSLFLGWSVEDSHTLLDHHVGTDHHGLCTNKHVWYTYICIHATATGIHIHTPTSQWYQHRSWSMQSEFRKKHGTLAKLAS